ncbi:MAG: hypothetical protein K6F48_09425 [Paludibacteraceae bacterium]|nr:hypothetical protein [Paludibacteraceae bacterium]
MKLIPVFIAFFSISVFNGSAETIHNCVRASTGECIVYDVGAGNPRLCDAQACRLYATLGNHYLAHELSHSKLEAVIPARTLVFAADMEWFGYALYNRLRTHCALSKRLSGHCAIGVGFRLASLHYEGKENRNLSLAEDITFLFQGKSTDLYAKGENLFDTGWQGICGERLKEPVRTTLGVQFHFSESVSCAIESYWEGDRNLFGRFGTLYDIGKFQLRCGVTGPPIVPSFGCGFLGKNFRLDLSSRWIRNLGYALDCGIGYTFIKKESEVPPINE